MARRTTTRKPAKRKAAGGSAGRWAGRWGWIAAAALGAAWTASDGRPAAYVETAIASLRPAGMPPAAAADAVSGVDRTASTPHAAPLQDRSRLPVPRPAHQAIRPAVAASSPPARVAAVIPSARVSLPLARMPASDALQAARSSGAAAGIRHATRKLTIRSAPDGASPIVGSIEPAAMVTVTGAVGPWRHVRNARGDEGWTDGTYLAGEAGPLTAPAAFRQAEVRHDAVPATAAVALPRPVPPLGVGTETTGAIR